MKRAIKRFGKTNFSKRVGDMINFVVRSSWSVGALVILKKQMGRTAGRLCWVAGCYAMIILFPLAMEVRELQLNKIQVDREQTMMEIQNRERERLTRPRRSQVFFDLSFIRLFDESVEQVMDIQPRERDKYKENSDYVISFSRNIVLPGTSMISIMLLE